MGTEPDPDPELCLSESEMKSWGSITFATLSVYCFGSSYQNKKIETSISCVDTWCSLIHRRVYPWGPPTNPHQQVTMAERKLPCCDRASVSQRRSTMGPTCHQPWALISLFFPPASSLCPSFTAPVATNDSPPCGASAQRR